MNDKATAIVIDDEGQIRKLLRVVLEKHGYDVVEAETGKSGLAEIATRRPDVVLLDLGLPDMDGIEILKRLREWSQVPVLILSVREAAEQKVAALDAGADDYVTKPFDPTELLARLRAIQRRGQEGEANAYFQTGNLAIDFSGHIVTVNGHEVKLTATEYDLLRVLALNAGKVVTHSHLLREVWGPNATEQSNCRAANRSCSRPKAASATDWCLPMPNNCGLTMDLDSRNFRLRSARVPFVPLVRNEGGLRISGLLFAGLRISFGP